MEENEPKLIYLQDGVTLKAAHQKYSCYVDTVGSLSIIEHPQFKMSIDWKPNNFVMFETMLDHEWTLVSDVTEKPDTNESLSHNARVLSLMLEDIDKVINKNKTVTFITKPDKVSTKFCFHHGNVDRFTRFIHLYCETKAVGRDTLQVVRANIKKMPAATFGNVDMFEDLESHQPWKAVGSIVKNLKERPVETAWEAGTKVLDALLGIPTLYMVEMEQSGISENNEETSNKTSAEYEVIRQPQNLPPRPDISRGIPLNETQWLMYQDNTGRITDVDAVKKIIFRGGVHPSIRRVVWKYLLNYYPWEMTSEERKIVCKERAQEYFIMKQQWKTMSALQESRFFDFHERKSLVEKDVNRTDRSYPFYAGENNPNLSTLFDILLTYIMYNFDLGYVQGMSDLLSPIFFLMNNEVDAFWCFSGFMDKVHTNFDIDQAGMKHQLQQLFELLSFINPEFTKYLSKNDSANMYFCFRWLLVLFKREFSQTDIMRLWEVIWTGLPCENFHLLICISILDTEKNEIIERDYEFSKILKHINDLSMKLNLEQILIKAEAIYEQLYKANHLPNNIRSILGFKLLPEDTPPENEVPDATNEMISLQESVCLDHNIKAVNGVNIQPEIDEVSFQTSLDLNHL